MDPSSTADFRRALRDAAQRLGLPEWWRWWMGELWTLIPEGPRHALQRRRLRPVLVFEHDAAVLWQAQATGRGVVYVERTRIPREGDAAAHAGRVAMDALPRSSPLVGATGPRVIIALTPEQVLHKRLSYPAATEESLDQVLRYDLDRHTPFKTDQVYYDAAIVGRDAAHKEIRVELVAALKSVVDPFRRQAAAWGASVVGIAPAGPQRQPGALFATPFNLLPAEERIEHSAWRRWQVWVPLLLIVALALAALAVPLWQKRTTVIALQQSTEQARVHAAASDALRQQLEQATGDYNFVLDRKYAFPSTVALLDDVTRLLPDDTWLTQLELKSVPKGKEPHHELLLRGESANAGRLVSLLEDSHLFDQATPRSPTTKIQPGPGEIFDLGAQVKPLPPTTRVDIASAALPRAADATGAQVAPTPPGANTNNKATPGATGARPPTPPVNAISGTSPGAAGTTPTGVAAPARPPPTPSPNDAAPATFGPVAPDGRSPGAASQ